MKLDKVYVYGDKAQSVVANRLAIVPPSPTQLKVLYLLRKRSMTAKQLRLILNQVGYNGSAQNVHTLLTALLSQALIDKYQAVYSISSLGRSYLSGIRNYLFNIRM